MQCNRAYQRVYSKAARVPLCTPSVIEEYFPPLPRENERSI